MQINPGGRLATKDVMGRDNEIARYWQVLERQGLVISAERRIGKTHIMLKMQDECRSGFLPFYQDLEAVQSIPELVRSIYGTIQRALNASPSRELLPRLRAYVAKWAHLLPSRIAGVDLPTGDSAWLPFLSGVFDDLIDIADNQIILLLWDEFPLMLHNLQRRAGPDAAIQLLDHLRAVRLRHAGSLRFLFTGSIGLHLVLRSLRAAGNTNDPVNDMLSLTVRPMAHQDTTNLAAALLEETCAVPSQIPGLASRIATEVGGFPYYVHHVADQLHQLRRPPLVEDVAAAVDNLVYDSHDPANFNYYVNRLSLYYAADEEALALIVLDTIAGLPSPVPIPKLINLCRHRDPSLEDERLRDVLTVLAEDHYIEPRKSADVMAYDFRWQLVKRWWKEKRS